MASMNVKELKKMRGFMCHCSTVSSVIVPRHQRLSSEDRVSLIDNKQRKSYQFGEKRAVFSANYVKRSMLLSSSSDEEDELEGIRPRKAADSTDNVFQVVVMRVSIHCQGCASKVKKHLSKMEGVTSYSVDLESKRVLVMGHVSPSDVVDSISKVKNAHILASFDDFKRS